MTQIRHVQESIAEEDATIITTDAVKGASSTRAPSRVAPVMAATTIAGMETTSAPNEGLMSQMATMMQLMLETQKRQTETSGVPPELSRTTPSHDVPKVQEASQEQVREKPAPPLSLYLPPEPPL